MPREWASRYTRAGHYSAYVRRYVRTGKNYARSEKKAVSPEQTEQDSHPSTEVKSCYSYIR